MKEEDICIWIFKKMRKPILQAIPLHDKCNLNIFKKNKKKVQIEAI